MLPLIKPMQQNMVVVKADEMARDLSAKGRVALYGIFFDTDSAEIKKESKAALEEIFKLLQKEPALVLHVAGHTHNVGDSDHNLSLSDKRRQAVMETLWFGTIVAAARLRAHGVGMLAP